MFALEAILEKMRVTVNITVTIVLSVIATMPPLRPMPGEKRPLTFPVGKRIFNFPGRKVGIEMEYIAPEHARDALDAVADARARVAAEVGLPRWYWWVMAGAWVALGILGEAGPMWVVNVATLTFGIAHSIVASRWLGGRRRTARLQVSADVAGRRTPIAVVGMLLALVAMTVVAGLALHSDGARHAGIWSALLVAAIVGFGGPEILAVLRRALHA